MTDDQLQMTNSVEDDLLWERWRCEVDSGQGKQRIDKYLADHMTNTSRNRIQTAADAGNVWVNGNPVASNDRVKPGDVIQVLLDHEPHDFTITPENIPLSVVYEDDDLLVVNKPAGLVVHADGDDVRYADGGLLRERLLGGLEIGGDLNLEYSRSLSTSSSRGS